MIFGIVDWIQTEDLGVTMLGYGLVGTVVVVLLIIFVLRAL
jgi:hypothetical protein